MASSRSNSSSSRSSASSDHSTSMLEEKIDPDDEAITTEAKDLAIGGAASSDTYESSLWAQIFEEGQLDTMEGVEESMGTLAAARFPHMELVSPAQAFSTDVGDHESVHDTAHWTYYDETEALRSLPPLTQHLPPGFDSSSGVQVSSDEGAAEPPSAIQGARRPISLLQLSPRLDGQPYPLSKPIIRDDGVLLVGTEFVGNPRDNRIFVTNFHSFHPNAPAPYLQVQADVRDLKWVTPYAAITAVDRDIQIIQVGDEHGDRSCRLLDPLRRVHSDTIRELAVNASSGHPLLASGGFDETVVLMDLGQSVRAPLTNILTKFDAYDVVSSLRWMPHDGSHVSWTTDGGDFQLADLRVRTAQLQVPLSSALTLDGLGGLYSHEYLSDRTVILGFESGDIVFVDLRMARKDSCVGGRKSPLRAIGDLRRSNDDTIGVFGLGGFSNPQVNPARDGVGQMILALANGTGSIKTCGDFSLHSEQYLAVSDSHGIVSIYDNTRGPSQQGPDNAFEIWHERAV